MGCRSSKNTSDEELEDGGSKKVTNSKADKAKPREPYGEMEPSWGTKTERCATDDDFVYVVEEALRVNFELITFNEFKNYISSRYTCEADESFQDEIIHRVIGEQFVKGCLAIKLV